MVRSLRAGGIACLGVGVLFLAHVVPVPAQEASSGPIVTYPDSSQDSAPLSSAPPARATVAGEVPKTIPIHPLPQGEPVPGGEHANDNALQNNAGNHLTVEQRPAFQGIIQDGFVPSDQNIAVGPTLIVQVVNSEIAILDKATGIMEAGYPKQLSSLWAGLTGACSQSNSGDPIVQYDRMADRWIVTQLASVRSPYAECIAVSQTNDPSGKYNLYSYPFGSTLNDYPKFSVWPTATNSAYFATYNLFANGNTFSGAELCAYDRAAMLAGAPNPVSICFQVADGGVLPSDVDGPTPPPDGAPGYFIDFDTSTSLALREFSPNFAAPASSTLISLLPDLTVPGFSEACNGGTCIPQLGTSRKLDSLGDRLMYRFAYRNFGDHESLVVNHSIVSGSSVAPRWYLLKATPAGSGSFTVTSGTYAPDSSYRWMGSIAMDQAGDMALGYSKSSSTVYPSVAVTGIAGDGTMGAETILQAGGGSQTGTTRWGDYSSMRVDPSDDCTFWYTNQFYPKTASYNWYTYIGAFNFNTCGGAGSTGANDFLLSLNNSIVKLAAGASDSSSTVTVAPGSTFNSAVMLSSTCGASITCSFGTNPVPGGSGSSTLTVSVANGAPSGTMAETITGIGGGLTRSIAFTVKVPAAAFTLSAPASTSPSTIRRGSSGSALITANDVPGVTTKSPVTLQISSSVLPNGVVASLSTSSISSTGGSATLKITSSRQGSTGPFSVTVTGSDFDGTDGTTNSSVTITGSVH